MKRSYTVDMCSGPVLSKMLMFALPLMLSSILQLLFNAADIIVVGRFAGDQALAAVGSTSSIINLLTNIFVGLSVGANVLTARYLGSKEDKELSETIHTAMLLSIISGVILTVIGVVCAKQILIWMQTPDTVLDLAVLYLRIYFAGMTAMMIYNFGSAILRASGDTRRPLYFLTAAGVINIGLNLFFVIKLNLSVAGVALATIVSQSISAILIIICMTREQGVMKLNPKKLKIHKSKLKKIIQVGLPAGIQGSLFSLSNVVIQSSINSFGDVVMAGNSAAANIEGFVYAAMNSFYQTAISFTSQNYGAGNIKRIRKILVTALACVTVTGVFFGGGAYALGKYLLRIYSANDAVIQAGIARMGVICVTYFLCGMMDVMVGMLRGVGCSVLPTCVSLLGACGFRILWIFTIFRMEEYHTIKVLYLSYPASWILTLTVHIICFTVIYKRLLKKQALSNR
ncbi:MAG: MATE family efflux transporter [Clostridiales bacterium]|nr:MATE family efflux transporter [Clostridiales bacterium]